MLTENKSNSGPRHWHHLGRRLVAGRRSARQSQQPAVDESTREQAHLLAEVMDRVKREYVEPIDDAELLENAIRGMVADLDRHSAYLDADEYQDIRASTTGRYSGVGLEVSVADGAVTVIAPIDGTPAQRSRYRSGRRDYRGR